MKKITLVTVCMLLACSTMFAQRISDLTVEGATALTPFGAFNPKNNGGRTGIGEIIYKNTTDLSNVNVTLNVGSTATVTEPSTWPTDWSSTVSGIKVESTESSDWADYNITIKKINPGTLPMEISTGTDGDFDSDSWTPETVGWAGAAIDRGKSVIRFGSANRSFVVAFKDAPDKIKFTMKSLGDWDTEVENIFDVEASPDGENWTTVIKYSKTELMPPSSPPTEREFQLDPEARFVRWVYSVRDKASGGGFNVLLEDVSITKLANSIDDIKKSEIGAKFISERNLLTFNDNISIKKISLYAISGATVYEQSTPEKSIVLPNLGKGVYLLKMNLKDGFAITEKLIKK